jgi:hypothetical protein
LSRDTLHTSDEMNQSLPPWEEGRQGRRAPIQRTYAPRAAKI